MVDRALPYPASSPILVEPLASGVGDCKAGWLVRHTLDRAVADQRIGEGAVVQAGSRGGFRILERNTGCPVLGGPQNSITVAI